MNHRFLLRGFLLLLSAVYLLPGSAVAQEQRFKAGIILGVNASQINGDDIAGFDKLGLRGGLRGIILLGERSDLTVDLLFSERGSASELVPNNQSLRRIVRTRYVEVPVLFNYRDWLSPKGHYQVHIAGGLSYGRLFDTFVDAFGVIEEEQVNFSNNDLSLVVGVGYAPSPKLEFAVRYNRSVIPLYNNDKYLTSAGIPRFKYMLWGYFLSFEAIYQF